MRTPMHVLGLLAMIALGLVGLYLKLPYSGALLIVGCVAALCHDW